MEIYTFVHMGGKSEQMIVVPIHDDDEDLESKLTKFDASQAQCFLPRDRDKLCDRHPGSKREPCPTRPDSHVLSPCSLAVVEASFGEFTPFNKLVRSLMATKMKEASESRARRKAFRKSGLLARAVTRVGVGASA